MRDYDSRRRYRAASTVFGVASRRIEFVLQQLLKLHGRELARYEAPLVTHQAAVLKSKAHHRRWVNERWHDYRIGVPLRPLNKLCRRAGVGRRAGVR